MSDSNQESGQQQPTRSERVRIASAAAADVRRRSAAVSRTSPADVRDVRHTPTVGVQQHAHGGRAEEGDRQPGRGKGPLIPMDIEGSGARHIRTRNVAASQRRQRDQSRTTDSDDGWPDIFQSDDDPQSLDEPAHRPPSRRRTDSSSVESTRRSQVNPVDDWIVRAPVPGGPRDGTVIPSFLGHVSSKIWEGEFRGMLKCQNRYSACQKLVLWYKETSEEVRDLINLTGLAHLPDTMYAHLDVPLLSAFVERWQPDTSSFHMPFGEMTITLHDVWYILRIPVEGSLITDTPDKLDLQRSCAEILGISVERLASGGHLAQGGILIESVIELCSQGAAGEAETEAIAWIWLTLGCTLFVDKSGHRFRPACLWEVRDGLGDAPSHSWGSATLAYLYRQLGVASRGDCQGLSGCLTLLQAWIYEYFSCFRPNRERLILDPVSPRASTWSVSSSERADTRVFALRTRLDQLTADEVTWLPFGIDPAITVPRTAYMGWIQYRDISEPYMPVRVLRQLGYVHIIPPPIYRPEKAVRPWSSLRYVMQTSRVAASDRWGMFPFDHMLPFLRLDDVAVSPSACAPEYLEWYARHSHPRLLNTNALPAQARPSRSNTDYWLAHSTALSQRFLCTMSTIHAQHSQHCVVDGIPEMEQAIAAHAEELEQIMREFRLTD
ncbi:protein MAIN-LIKE 1-like [Mercurialis annua]|uniref:protein MAIN-LIKE 1-like n=1 Tax=Mercurialis annua TaxID=3986 RepID=UPI0024AF9B95|nr:protein MAIN-LIKE 1-like [Mercurialis annua]